MSLASQFGFPDCAVTGFSCNNQRFAVEEAISEFITLGQKTKMPEGNNPKCTDS
jgi:hypothetical protein